MYLEKQEGEEENLFYCVIHSGNMWLAKAWHIVAVLIYNSEGQLVIM